MSKCGTEYNVLFVGSGNCARSIMAEAILNREGRGRFRAYSAGILADTALDHNAVDLLKTMNFDVSIMRPQQWIDFAGETGMVFDFAIMVAEEAKLLPQAMWQGHPIFAHWGMPDPARVEGNDAQVRLAYADTFRMLSNRIGIFVNLPLRSLDLLSLQCRLDMIGNPAPAASAGGVAA